MVDKRQLHTDAIERGGQAGFISSVVSPYISQRITLYVQQMAAMYRGNEYTHDMLLGKVAEMSALLSLLADLESQQRAGDIAAEKEFRHGATQQ